MERAHLGCDIWSMAVATRPISGMVNGRTERPLCQCHRGEASASDLEGTASGTRRGVFRALPSRVTPQSLPSDNRSIPTRGTEARRRRACPGRRDRKMHPGARPLFVDVSPFSGISSEERRERGEGARRRAKRAGERTRTPRGSRGTAPRDEASRGVCAAVWGRAIALIGKTARRARESDTDVKLGPRRSHVSENEDRRDLGRGLGALPLTPPWLGTVGPERRTRRRPCDRRAPHAAAPGARQ